MAHNMTDEELRALIPQTDAGLALSRMKPEDRLPRYSPNGPAKGKVLSEALQKLILGVGQPQQS